MKFQFLGFCIGGGANLSTPVFKLRYTDRDWYRCISIVAYFMGFQASVTIPLWKDNEAIKEDNWAELIDRAKAEHEYVTGLEAKNACLRKALERVLNSEVVKNAPFAGYSEALSDAREALEER